MGAENRVAAAEAAPLVGELAEAAYDVVVVAVADAMFAARHAATKDGKPIGNAAAWRKFCDEPSLRLLRALAAFDAELDALLIGAGARRFGQQEAQTLAVIPCLLGSG